jgi:hypothetical protein
MGTPTTCLRRLAAAGGREHRRSAADQCCRRYCHRKSGETLGSDMQNHLIPAIANVGSETAASGTCPRLRLVRFPGGTPLTGGAWGNSRSSCLKSRTMRRELRIALASLAPSHWRYADNSSRAGKLWLRRWWPPRHAVWKSAASPLPSHARPGEPPSTTGDWSTAGLMLASRGCRGSLLCVTLGCLFGRNVPPLFRHWFSRPWRWRRARQRRLVACHPIRLQRSTRPTR